MKFVQRYTYQENQDLRKTLYCKEPAVKTSLVNSRLGNNHLEEIDRSATAAADLGDVGAGVEGNRVTTLSAPEKRYSIDHRPGKAARPPG